MTLPAALPSAIDPAVLDAAARRYARQPEAPLTPGSVDPRGHVSLCAAAAIAAATVELRAGRQAANDYALAVAKTQDPNPVFKVFADLGLGRDACEAIMQPNNRYPASIRRQGVLALFEAMKTGAGPRVA